MTEPKQTTSLHDLCWLTAQASKTFTYASLASARGCSVPCAEAFVKQWRSDGLVEECGTGFKGRKSFRVMARHKQPRAGDSIAEREQSPEANMWAAMRQMKVFTAQDIAIASATDLVAVDEKMAHAYCMQLMRGDVPYLRVVSKAKPGIRPAAYRLVRNTGPVAPRERRVRVMWDANMGAYTYIPACAS